ncbi:unnamed protein product [Larinioides sclopetarius]|uniref:Uncharacterized protein n=1 Tax=Larinioides sclopetarius TaxID=280406 RepID=A0AAV1YQK7_9ARAC
MQAHISTYKYPFLPVPIHSIPQQTKREAGNSITPPFSLTPHPLHFYLKNKRTCALPLSPSRWRHTGTALVACGTDRGEAEITAAHSFDNRRGRQSQLTIRCRMELEYRWFL